MSNSFFNAVLAETDPMYDAAVITEEGTQYWKNDSCNNCNNSHSVTKFFFASAVGILEMQGRLSRYDKVTSFFSPDELPDGYDKKWDLVTVEDTLRHKTGINTDPYCVDEDKDRENIGDDFLKYVFSLKIEEKTGEFRRYSDEAFYLIANIITKASGKNAEQYLNENIFLPLGFRQWAMAKCPKGIPIAGGGFYARADDIAKLGYVYACHGMYENRRILSDEWIHDAMQNDYACTQFRDTDVYVKTGAKGQMVAFSQQRKASVAWHGYSNQGNDRNDRLLEAFVRYLDEINGSTHDTSERR